MKCGDEIELVCEGDDEEAAMTTIKALIGKRIEGVIPSILFLTLQLLSDKVL